MQLVEAGKRKLIARTFAVPGALNISRVQKSGVLAGNKAGNFQYLLTDFPLLRARTKASETLSARNDAIAEPRPTFCFSKITSGVYPDQGTQPARRSRPKIDDRHSYIPPRGTSHFIEPELWN
jgi:hypothetical protein